MHQIAAYEPIDISEAIDVIASSLESSDEEVAKLLEQAGYSEVHASLIVGLVPSAFAHPLLLGFGIEKINPATSVPSRLGSRKTLMLRDLPIYCSALAIARDIENDGRLSESTYRSIASRSAEFNAVQQAIDAGTDVAGGVITVALIGPYAEDLGFT